MSGKQIQHESFFEKELGMDAYQSGVLDTPTDEGYDKGLALYPEDVETWLRESQPDAWQSLVKQHGTESGALATVCQRLRKVLDTQGTLDVFRAGIDLVGLRHRLDMAQFKPAFSVNEELVRRYQANVVRLVHQVHYSAKNANSLDLVLFVNGVPFATFELKTQFTQSVEIAKAQYRFDRPAKGEPLLEFPRGAIVHFAADNSEVYMTTRLAGASTNFLPFNKGNAGGKGNPLNSDGNPTDYLFSEVLTRDGVLDLLGRYIFAMRGKQKEVLAYIFPRYHQLDATRKLLAAVKEEGAGKRYLIQHSAGSGKTNSIAWTAHFLSELHTLADDKMFQSVIVISDRNVIDKQLQEAVMDMERTPGVVETVTRDRGVKSTQLTEALGKNKKVIVCTLQTFPFILREARKLFKETNAHFAVIADEAHSSQSGRTMDQLKKVLSAGEIKELGDGGEYSVEDVLASQMAARRKPDGITYIAFTATPKPKTLELFGRVPQVVQGVKDPNEKRTPEPFHVYSMRQAIEEGFILDVLQNYLSYKVAFKLASDRDGDVPKAEAKAKMVKWVKLHEYNIAQKVGVILDHYKTYVSVLLNGRAKAMIVVSSRKEAVRWKLALDKTIAERNLPYNALVAFSGKVHDPETLPEDVSETSPLLNPKLNGRDIRKAFNEDTYQVLLVANKFQTGFDQPLLCAMYVDKRLDGVQAVQTLSRLNRCYPGKDTTYVLDFVNDPEEILKAFKAYYETARLSDITDPNQILDLRTQLDKTGFYSDAEVNQTVLLLESPDTKQKDLIAVLMPVAKRITDRYDELMKARQAAEAAKDKKAIATLEEELDAVRLFVRQMGAFTRLYIFLAQLYDYGNTEIEKRYRFYLMLTPLIKLDGRRDDVDLGELTLTHYRLRFGGPKDLTLAGGEPLNPIKETGGGKPHSKEKIQLQKLIEALNKIFFPEGTSEEDRLSWFNSKKAKMAENPALLEQAKNNTLEQMLNSKELFKAFQNAIMDSDDANTKLSDEILNSPERQNQMIRLMLEMGGLYQHLRAVATPA
jgi:type I restriction enzyme R subunit